MQSVNDLFQATKILKNNSFVLFLSEQKLEIRLSNFGIKIILSSSSSFSNGSALGPLKGASRSLERKFGYPAIAKTLTSAKSAEECETVVNRLVEDGLVSEFLL